MFIGKVQGCTWLRNEGFLRARMKRFRALEVVLISFLD